MPLALHFPTFFFCLFFWLVLAASSFFALTRLGIQLFETFLYFISGPMSVYVSQRKNDQYREGRTAFLGRSGKVTCPGAVTERLSKLLLQSSSARVFLLARIIVEA